MHCALIRKQVSDALTQPCAESFLKSPSPHHPPAASAAAGHYDSLTLEPLRRAPDFFVAFYSPLPIPANALPSKWLS